MFIVVDRQKCTGLGICESIAPDVFEIDDDGSLRLLTDEIGDDGLAAVEEAVRSCPTTALALSAVRE